jgi:hypothetical protein
MFKKPQMTRTQSELKFFIDTLASDECQCGRHKQPGRAVCFKCYARLPDDKRRALFRRVGAGFEAAYEDAYRFLNDL